VRSPPVRTPRSTSCSEPMTPPQTWANTEEAARLEDERRRKELTAVFAETYADILIAEGDVQSVLASTIGQRKIDLVVIGTRGRSGFKKFFLGSVAEEIFREVSCPVLTVGPNAPLVVPQNGSPQRILYATDFNAESNLAASYALSLAQEFQASLTLIHVVAPRERENWSTRLSWKVTSAASSEAWSRRKRRRGARLNSS
jgi:nucleotide-binding universal stress UspA family protein